MPARSMRPQFGADQTPWVSDPSVEAGALPTRIAVATAIGLRDGHKPPCSSLESGDRPEVEAVVRAGEPQDQRQGAHLVKGAIAMAYGVILAEGLHP